MSPISPARRGVAATILALLAMASMAACGSSTPKSVPNVTIRTSSTSAVITPSNYCFDPTTHCHATSTKISTIDAKRHSTITIDVPRVVADQHWIVTAFTVTAGGKSTPIDGAGSELLHDAETVRVPVANGTGNYILSVAELRGLAQSGTWSVRVQITE